MEIRIPRFCRLLFVTVLLTGLTQSPPAASARATERPVAQPCSSDNRDAFLDTSSSQGSPLKSAGEDRPRAGASGAESQWTPMDSGTTDSLTDVWGTSGTNVFAVSYEGGILHYDGNAWSQMASNNTFPLRAIWGSNSSNVFAVGGGWDPHSGDPVSVVLHYDGSRWSSLDPGIHWPLYGVWGTSASNVFVVGGGWLDPHGPYGVVFRYDGSGWHKLSSFDDSFSDIWGSGEDDIFAVGGDAWAVGWTSELLAHYNGSDWQAERAGWGAPLRSVWGASPNAIFVVGESDTILHHDGVRWNEINTGGRKHLLGVWGTGANDVFAVGGEWTEDDGSFGIILHYDGETWRPMEHETDNWLRAVWASGRDHIFAVGDHGTILHYRAGFTPIPDGYSFCNGPTSRSCDPGWGDSRQHGDFTADDMVAMFGEDAVCNMRNGTCQLKLTASAWLSIQNSSLNGGHCFGMASTSLRFYQGIGGSDRDEPSDFQPDAANTYALNLDNIRRHIAFHHVMQATRPLKKYIRSQRAYNEPSDVLDQLRSATPGSSDDPMMLVMHKWEGFPSKNPQAHAVTPYAVQQKEDGIWWVYVYDNNYPGNDTLYIAIDTAANTWDYVGHDWAGGAIFPRTLTVVPMSKFDQPPSCPWCTLARANSTAAAGMAEVWLEGRSHLLVTDDLGRRIGYADGQYVNEIPGAYETVLAGGLESDREPIYTIPLTDAYEISLDSRLLTRTEEVAVAQFGPGYATMAAGIAMEPDSQDRMILRPDGTQLGYRAQNDKEIDIALTRENVGESQQFSLRNVDVGPGETVTMTLDPDLQSLVFSNEEASGGDYSLDFRRVGTTAWHWFVHGNIAISGTDTHNLDVGGWNGSGPMILRIDRGSDGIIEETLELKNHVKVVFLPFIGR